MVSMLNSVSSSLFCSLAGDILGQDASLRQCLSQMGTGIFNAGDNPVTD